MSTLSTLQNSASSKEQSDSNDVEAARDERGTNKGQETLQIADESALPSVDGGVKAWSVIGGAFLALFVQFGLGEFTRGASSHYPCLRAHLQPLHIFELHCTRHWCERIDCSQ